MFLEVYCIPPHLFYAVIGTSKQGNDIVRVLAFHMSIVPAGTEREWSPKEPYNFPVISGAVHLLAFGETPRDVKQLQSHQIISATIELPLTSHSPCVVPSETF